MTSLWLDHAPAMPDDPLPEGERLDDVVVGAGITGLTTALLLARAGRKVAVVEARTVGAVATGNTTAKISLLQGTRYSSMLRHQSERVARAYAEANREGQEWLLRFCEDHGVPVQRRIAATYAASQGEVSAVRREHEAAKSAGLEVRWVEDLDVPFPQFGATVLDDQAQFDPMDLLAALVEQIRAHGGTVSQGHRVVTMSKLGRPRLRLEGGRHLESDNVVLATGTPILDRSLYFAKLEPQRSYALAFSGAAAPHGMYLSAGSDSRSVRDAPRAEGELLLVGGSGHGVGRTRSEEEHVDRLRAWTAEHFPGAVETNRWSAQDYTSHDMVPYVGKMPRGGGRVYVATGFAKWGMTNGVWAARDISAQILGEMPSWARPMHRRITRPSGALHLATINVKVGVSLVASALGAVRKSAPSAPPAGTGVVGRDGLVPEGVATTDGRTCAVLGVCTHLGGVLKWNDAEQSFDCPLHGSRFAPDGSVLEGPATRPLHRRAPG